ncbi:Y+L amino acid transporter 2 [Anoplophora glabripennis]|nr:Y+L amino acid transporter 2 [Anoplophora glabripennis]XP_018574727.1 Y+L amino acid transporter 2 [Anoplophora glabripennis]XP_018574728.1 Y+L amino acid transporter 2 [Anoplophora glabripennis]
MPSQTKDVQSPAENKLLPEIDDGKVKMKKHMGLLEGVAIILGIIFGSGIFISPKGIIQEVDSIGFSLVVWVLCGLLSMIGALCYAELGTSIPKSGGDYAYINEAFGPLPSFLYLWAANIIFVPTTNAIMGLTFAKYVIQPFFPQCDMPDIGVRLVAAAVICALSFLNGYNVKATIKLQNVFMFCKIAALVGVILIGVVWMSLGNMDNFKNSFEGTTTNPGKIAKAFYSGIFSYSGWNYLNFMTEELKNPFVNLPRAIYISLPLVTGIYVLANMAYLSVLSPDAMVSSDAIAVTFGNAVLGKFAWILPIMVAISAFGGLSVHIMTASRMMYVGARDGHFPVALAHLNINRLTPAPSLAFLCFLSLLMLSTSDIHLLIQYCSIVESFFVTLSVSGLLYLRWKNPKMIRPIRINIFVPILFVVLCLFLLFLPLVESPLIVLGGLLITLSGIPFYYFGVIWKTKPETFQSFMRKITLISQKVFIAAHEDE